MAEKKAASRAALHGVLIVDKPRGPTSHDVVARLRRALGEKRVGHAGTLDPMATGVLVALVGEGTKLAPYMTAADKRYTARVALGVATATLDAEGPEVARAEVPDDLLGEIRAIEITLQRPIEMPNDQGSAGGGGASDTPHRATLSSSLPLPSSGRVAAAIRAEIARTEQVPPAFSAIQIDGERSHDLARAGKAVELAPRAVAVRSCDVTGARAAPGELPSIDLDVAVSKGYYVRSLARDLGEQLGVPAHLAALRRTMSGAFSLADAIALDAGPDALRAAIIPIAEAARRALPIARLTADGAVRARQGKRLAATDFEGAPPPDDVPSAWLDAAETLVAVGEAREGAFAVLRGFAAA